MRAGRDRREDVPRSHVQVDTSVLVPDRTGETGARVRNSVMGVTEYQEWVQGSQILGAGTLEVRARCLDNGLSF